MNELNICEDIHLVVKTISQFISLYRSQEAMENFVFTDKNSTIEEFDENE